MVSLRLQIPPDVCYGSMAFFTAILHNIFLLYHVDMFVSVYKIDKVSFWVGEAIFLVWNSCNDPLFGWLSDKKYLSAAESKGHSGVDIVLKRVTSLQRNGPLFALSFLAFWVSWVYPPVQFVICLCLYDGFLTLIDLHHSALLADLAVSAETRTKLNSRCSIFGIFGSASVFMSYAIWNKDNLDFFRLFCICLAVTSFLGFLLCASLLRQSVINNQKDFKMISRNEHTMNLVQVFHCHFNSNFFPLFLENLLGDAVSPTFCSLLIGISFVAPHINNLYFLTLCRRYGVYAVIRLLFIIKLSMSVVMFLMGPDHLWMLCLFIASNRIFTEGTCKLLNLVISDLVDEDYVLHGRKQAVSALMFGTAALVSKPGQTFAPLIGTWVLAMQTGHDIFHSGNQAGSIKMGLRSSSALTQAMQRQGCFNMLVYIPIVCAVVQLVIWTKFSLHGRRLRLIKDARGGMEQTLV